MSAQEAGRRERRLVSLLLLQARLLVPPTGPAVPLRGAPRRPSYLVARGSYLPICPGSSSSPLSACALLTPARVSVDMHSELFFF